MPHHGRMNYSRLPLVAAATVLSLCSSTAADSQIGAGLGDLFKIQSGVKSKRVSSYDRTGGNNDRMENIPDGERRVLCDIKGAGLINHIWITISPPPPTVDRNDIILRMYWDGNDFPSVESPIGPFFGQ